MTNLQNHYLIAMPGLDEPMFRRSVTLICEHNKHGALGFTINRPLGITLADIFSQMSIQSALTQVNEQPVLSGGPVQIEQGFVIHRESGHWQSSLQFFEQMFITTSKDILTAIANHEGPAENIVLLGYSGWGAGQLEDEIAKNYWLVSPADPTIMFDYPIAQRWHAAAQLIGIDMEKLSRESGHA